LWRLRCILEPKGIKKGTYLIKSSTGEIGFNHDSDYWLDIATFENKAHGSLKNSADSVSINAVSELEGALQLYSGGLLEGFYEDWTLNDRLHLQNTYMRSLEWLMQYYRHNVDYQSSILYAQKILESDPLREDIHCEVMQMYMSAGQRTLALKQYERCSNVLASELKIIPNAN
jgi:two-component SAPR family response regulator